MSPSWQSYFIEMARLAASKSKDPSTKVGCVIVGPDMEVRATGFNGFARGVSDDVDRYADKDAKLIMMVHAEANAIAAAVHAGLSALFTAVSLVRSYTLRRLFERLR